MTHSRPIALSLAFAAIVTLGMASGMPHAHAAATSCTPPSPTDPGYVEDNNLLLGGSGYSNSTGQITYTSQPAAQAQCASWCIGQSNAAQKNYLCLYADGHDYWAPTGGTYRCYVYPENTPTNSIGTWTPYGIIQPGVPAYQGSFGHTRCTYGVATPPTATLSANPASITAGQSSTLTWSSTNATSCTGTNFSTGGATSGSVAVTPGATTNYSVTCSGTGGSASDSATVSVSNPVTPDLTAGPVSAVSGTVGQAVSLSAPVANIGNGPTGAPFTDTFFIDSDQDTSNGYIAAPGYTSGVPNGFPANYSETNANVSRTFASPGTYYYRACADNDASYQGAITESNEGNNCSNWATITIASIPAPQPTCSLTANPSTVPSTLTWSSTNATSCTGGGFSTGGATSGTASVSASGTYSVSCTGTGGTCPLQIVNVGSQACINPTGTLTATPNRVEVGSSVNIAYSASGITTSCTVSGPGVSQVVPANSCAVPSGTVSSGPLSTQSTYLLMCDGIERARTVVNVVPKFNNF